MTVDVKLTTILLPINGGNIDQEVLDAGTNDPIDGLVRKVRRANALR